MCIAGGPVLRQDSGSFKSGFDTQTRINPCTCAQQLNMYDRVSQQVEFMEELFYKIG